MTDASGDGLLELPPLGVYVHLPWCVRKCPYCDFNSHALRGTLPEPDYLDALLADIGAAAASFPRRPAESLFFGGGTPSLFSPTAIGRVLEALRSTGLLGANAEVTLEANPGAVEHGSFRGYADAGVNRVSLGVQSFDPAKLARLGRIHTPDDARSAMDQLASAGIENFNIDLMYGLPEQTVEEAARDVALALSCGAPHLSHYHLTLEPNTLFHHRPPTLPGEDETWEMQAVCEARIAAAGLSQYEVSAYARPGLECRHNLNYWTFGDYLGVGAGAHGKLTFPGRGHVERRAKPRHPDTYRNDPCRHEDRRYVSPADRVFEFMLNSLRLTDGFTLDLLQSRTGVRLARVASLLERAVRKGLLAADDRPGWRPTERGRRYLNDLQILFLPTDTP
jgi:oxygen-independent coproporphyrinogen-3 oxidase